MNVPIAFKLGILSSKVQMIKLFLLILSFNAFVIFSSASESEANSIPQEDKVNALNNLNKTVKTASVKGNNESKHDKEEIKTKTEIPHSPTLVEQKNISTVQNKTTNDVEKIAPSYNGPNMMEQESKYVTTGSMILISISLLFMVFVAFKTYRCECFSLNELKYLFFLYMKTI